MFSIAHFVYNVTYKLIKVMQHRKVQKCIQLFNAMSLCFVHYEKIYHDAWYDYAGQVRICLIKPIMTKDEKTRRYKLNFHSYISEVIRESEYMYKLDLGGFSTDFPCNL